MKNMKKIIGVILLTIYIYACSSDNVEQNVPIGPTPDVITVTRISLPSSYLNPNTYRWDLINATYVSATQSTIYSISQSIDFNFFNTNKGKSLLDTGYIYAPYVPLQLTPTMYDPFNFAPVKGIMTRYAKKIVN